MGKYTLSIMGKDDVFNCCDITINGTECAIDTAQEIAKKLYGLANVELYDEFGICVYTSKEE